MAGQNIFAEALAYVRYAISSLTKDRVLPNGIDRSRVTVEPPRDPTHGDMATNAAMVLAKEAGKPPRELAEHLVKKLRRYKFFTEADVAGPGFINLKLSVGRQVKVLRSAVLLGVDYGRSKKGKNKKINVEYVSANPTGPMHVGHGRGAVFGDALANLLAFAGYKITREYYINDAGVQVDVLARSAYQRYLEAIGREFSIGEGLYPGEYLKPVGQVLAQIYGSRLIEKQESEWLPTVRQIAIEAMLIGIQQDLKQLNITFDDFFSERALSEGAVKFWARDKRPVFYLARNSYDLTPEAPNGIAAYLATQTDADVSAIEFEVEKASGPLGNPNYLTKTLHALADKNLVFLGHLPPPKGAPVEDWEDREQTLFRSTEFGDDVDRPLKKSDGSYTYFASDVAYHRSKIKRGFKYLVDVWGADHGGYIKRMQAAVAALSDGKADLDVKVVQLVKLLRAGEPVKMSKRSGEFVTLREVVDEVGRDAVRFMMLFRKNDAVLDFDLAKVIEQSRDNPVFYVQYGHARGQSIFRNARTAFPSLPDDIASLASTAPLERLSDPAELALIRNVALYPRIIEAAAMAHEPHRIAFYLFDLASELHALYTLGNSAPHLRFIIQDDRQLTEARLVLIQGVVTVLRSGLELLGVEAPNEMR